ncbi:MAG: MotA/TolQ/ExbB proton channel family protein [Burkholderiaceae bacterium]
MTEFLHQASFGLMIISAIIATVVSVERIIFSSMNLKRAKLLTASIDTQRGSMGSLLGQDVVSEMVQKLLDDKAQNFAPAVQQDRADAAFIHAKDELGDRLWMLDTIVTAAPLMGLLGTIFGIVDTFLALSKSGMSDPAGVSAGIGTALYATALGISIALIGLFAFNFLSNRNERIGEHLKMLILRL